MTDEFKHYFLICYDIIDHKTRRKVMKLTEDYGVRVQKSVFEAFVTDAHLERLINEIKEMISEEDSYRIYQLSRQAYRQKKTMGKPFEHKPDEDVII